MIPECWLASTVPSLAIDKCFVSARDLSLFIITKSSNHQTRIGAGDGAGGGAVEIGLGPVVREHESGGSEAAAVDRDERVSGGAGAAWTWGAAGGDQAGRQGRHRRARAQQPQAVHRRAFSAAGLFRLDQNPPAPSLPRRRGC